MSAVSPPRRIYFVAGFASMKALFVMSGGGVSSPIEMFVKECCARLVRRDLISGLCASRAFKSYSLTKFFFL